MEVKGGVTSSIIDQLHTWDIEGDQKKKVKVVLIEVSLMIFIL